MAIDREEHTAQMMAAIEARIAEHEADPDVAEVLAAVAAFDADLAALVAQHPAEETEQVLRGVYRDAEGRVRTRHRRLRAL